MQYKSFTPEELTPRQRHQYLLGMVNPRPICFASTINTEGVPNLAPYSFFNIFSSTPPLFIFSVSNRRDGSQKDTLSNAKATGEVVINMVNYSIARQMAICGVEYQSDINEFDKGGFTPLPSVMVKPLRVKESLVQFECKVLDIKTLGDHAGAANLITAEAVLIHVGEDIFSEDDIPDPAKLDMVGRLGNANYCRITADSVFEIHQPPANIALGFDKLSLSIRSSKILTGHNLALLAGVISLPDNEQLESFKTLMSTRQFFDQLAADKTTRMLQVHQKLKEYLDTNQTENAWMLIITAGLME